METGLDRLLADPALRRPLAGRRVGLLAHPASVTRDLTHALDALAAIGDLRLTAAFGPQHGLRGDKQDNMIESPDFVDPVHGIPVFSLYGEVRRPTAAMMDTFDVLLVDLQDVGMPHLHLRHDAALRAGGGGARTARPCGCSIVRTRSAGRSKGCACATGWESFVGAGPAADAPRPHDRRARPLVRRDAALDVDYEVVAMQGWEPERRARASAGRSASAPG